MTDYIKREDVINVIRQMGTLIPHQNGLDYGDPMQGLIIPLDAIYEINSISTADVRENVRGKWIADDEDLEWGNPLIRYRCSKCKERPLFDNKEYEFILTKFCPYCGAEMKGVKHGR